MTVIIGVMFMMNTITTVSNAVALNIAARTLIILVLTSFLTVPVIFYSSKLLNKVGRDGSR